MPSNYIVKIIEHFDVPPGFGNMIVPAALVIALPAAVTTAEPDSVTFPAALVIALPVTFTEADPDSVTE